MTGAVLLVLLAAEGVTILGRRQLLTLHFFLGFLPIGPVLLKLGSTIYQFFSYYAGAAPYVRKGPPMPLLRLLGPVVIATSVGVIGSGVTLTIVGPGPSIWLFAHKAFFVLWLGAMTIHVVAYAPKLPRLLLSRLTGSLVLGLVIALASYHLAYRWTGFTGHIG
jgi:hypothetical protein